MLKQKISFDDIFDDIIPATNEEKIFFELLYKYKRVIYDWGYDNLWILENYDNEETSKKSSMTGENFIKITNVCALTSADLVVALFSNQIDVEIRNWKSTFKTEIEKIEYMDYYRKVAKENIYDKNW